MSDAREQAPQPRATPTRVTRASGRAPSCDHCPGSHAGLLPLFASASRKASTWLLLEHPGPWPAKAAQTELPAPAKSVVDAAAELGVRVQMIRRVQARRTTPPLRVYAGYPAGAAPSAAAGNQPWLESRELSSWEELSGLDVEALAAGRRPHFGDPTTERLVLVCTHGRHNACCARLGRPLATALGARYGDAVWETTHVGGDRYAANLVLLPHGLYYGSLDPQTATAAVDAYDRGVIALERFRGRAGIPEPLQAVEYFVRSRMGLRNLDALSIEPRGATGSVTEVTVRTDAASYRARVERVTFTPPDGDDCTDRPVSYRLLELAEPDRVHVS